MVQISIGKDETRIDGDKLKRPVHFFYFNCPVCGRPVALYGTRGHIFSLPKYYANGDPLNVWHLEINDAAMTVTITPSIGLHLKKEYGHTDKCHHVLTNQPFEYV